MFLPVEQPAYRDALAIAAGGNLIYPSAVPPSETFFEELANPESVRVGHHTTNFHIFNRAQSPQETGLPPLFVALTYACHMRTDLGVARMNALATRFADRQVMTVDYPGYGASSRWHLGQLSLKGLAKEYVQALTELQYEQVDAFGICIGGVLASYMAMELGERAPHLLTYTTPGFARDFGKPWLQRDRKSLLATMRAYRKNGIQQDGFSLEPFRHIGRVRLDKLHAGIRAFLLLPSGLGPLAAQLPEGLHENTRWHDVVATDDPLVNYKDHIRAVEQRDNVAPGTASLTIIGGVGHDFCNERIVLTARDAQKALEPQPAPISV